MPIDFGTNTYNTEKNRIATQHAWIHLIELEYDDLGNFIRITDNNEDVYYKGETYSAVYFKLATKNISTEGKLNTIDLQIRLHQVMTMLLKSYRGFEGCALKVIIGQTRPRIGSPSIGLLEDKAAIINEYTILKTTVNNTFATFTLGIPNLSIKNFPAQKYLKNFCPYTYTGTACKYTPPTYAATTISFNSSSNYILDSNAGFNTDNLDIGDNIAINGSNNNDGEYTVVSFTSDKIYVEEDLINESSGSSIILTYRATCDRSFISCKNRDNEGNYGGYPAMPYGNLTKPKG